MPTSLQLLIDGGFQITTIYDRLYLHATNQRSFPRSSPSAVSPRMKDKRPRNGRASRRRIHPVRHLTGYVDSLNSGRHCRCARAEIWRHIFHNARWVGGDWRRPLPKISAISQVLHRQTKSTCSRSTRPRKRSRLRVVLRSFSCHILDNDGSFRPPPRHQSPPEQVRPGSSPASF